MVFVCVCMYVCVHESKYLFFYLRIAVKCCRRMIRVAPDHKEIMRVMEPQCISGLPPVRLTSTMIPSHTHRFNYLHFFHYFYCFFPANACSLALRKGHCDVGGRSRPSYRQEMAGSTLLTSMIIFSFFSFF